MPKCPEDKTGLYADLLGAVMEAMQINTVARAAMFLGQLAHESGDLRWWQELASGDAYENRSSLGNTVHGDGPRFKGRGPIQLTGRANYARAGDAIGVDLIAEPDLVCVPEIGFRVAGWYWTVHGCNLMADSLDVPGVTKAINGGYVGLEDRMARVTRARDVLIRTALLQ
jgi:putative chitinase